MTAADQRARAPNRPAVAMTPAERKAKQRAAAIAKGLCVVCCINRARKGMSTCGPCSEAAQERVEASREG